MIDKLEYLLALAQEQHFGRAAAACGTTQPTLSAGIKQLEEMLGVLLVERGSRFRGFTAAGERTLAWARRIVGDMRAMRQEIEALRSTLAGELRLAAIPTSLPILTTLTAPFAVQHPDVRLVILSRTSNEVLAMLENLEVDAGISYLDNEPLGRVITVPLYRERFHLVCRAESPFAGRAAVPWAELAGLRLALLTPDMQNRRILDRALAQAGVAPNVSVQSDSMLSLLSHLRTGEWASILPGQWMQTLALAPGVVAVPLEAPEVANTVGLVLPSREPLPTLAAALAAAARQMAPLPAGD
ncbi:MAG: LysR family transcriptional regulator [Alphaproteobacteria bacterium]|nr:LysR family transcriptional regulator [Alphaproteobacteria bacterium]